MIQWTQITLLSIKLSKCDLGPFPGATNSPLCWCPRDPVFGAPLGLLDELGSSAERIRLASKTLPHSVPGWDAFISYAWAP